MGILYVMVGLSASGKTTIANDMAKKENCIIVSTDEIREEIFGDNIQYDNKSHQKVFDIYHERIYRNLKDGKNVIADATNIRRKYRSSLFNKIDKLDVKKIAYIVPRDFVDCLNDDRCRGSKSVGEKVISKQLHNFEIPFYEEGFDKIIIHGIRDYSSITRQIRLWIKGYYDTIETMMKFMLNFNQNNPYHNRTLGTHCMFTALEFKNLKYPRYYNIAAAIHDYGKLFTKTTDEDGISHYYNHANVGSYYTLSNIKWIMHDRKYSTRDALEMLFLINYHMLPMDWVKSSTKEKYRRILGEYKYNLLKDFNMCDKSR